MGVKAYSARFLNLLCEISNYLFDLKQNTVTFHASPEEKKKQNLG